MKRARKTSAEPKPALPVAFRPGPDLGQLVGAFACRHTLNANAAYRDLAALAVVGLDNRHYTLLAQLAEVLVGDNTFVRACVSVHAALVGAAVARGGLPPYE